MRGERGDRERLLDILEAIQAVGEHMTSRSDLDDPVAAAAAMHWVEIVGEAARHLSDEFVERYSDLPWRDAVRMRNRLIHGYFDVDLDLLWDTIEQDFPPLRDQIESILRDLT